MNCPRCGEVCGCQSEPPPTGVPASEVETEAAESSCVSATELGAEAVAQAADSHGTTSTPAETQPDAWRDELAARLNRYRSRRRMRPPRYPSLRLQFDNFPPDASSSPAEGHSNTPYGIHQDFAPVSEHALALDPANHAPQPAADAQSLAELRSRAENADASGAATSGAKIIEFPRFAWAPPSPPPDELADPVGIRPRILEVPETRPPAPALGGITIEAPERHEEKLPGIDFPLQTASLARRLLASFVDGLIIGLASALFGFIFWKVTAFRPALPQLVGMAVGIPVLLWFAYQYLLIVYSGRTPGLAAAGLELSLFDGRRANRARRRWRVLASYLSAASLAMGYVWVFLDEDLLCWHDRITHTYLATKLREGSTRLSDR